jgi:hypothetical protein
MFSVAEFFFLTSSQKQLKTRNALPSPITRWVAHPRVGNTRATWYYTTYLGHAGPKSHGARKLLSWRGAQKCGNKAIKQNKALVLRSLATLHCAPWPRVGNTHLGHADLKCHGARKLGLL